MVALQDGEKVWRVVHHSMVAESLFILSLDHKGYPGGRNWNLWQIQHTAKFWAAISLVYAEACEESNSMFAGLPSLGHVWANMCPRVLTEVTDLWTKNLFLGQRTSDTEPI